MAFTRDRLQAHISAAETLTAHNIPAPKAWEDLKRRFGQFQAADRPCLDALTAAVLGADTPENLDMLRACAIAESGDVVWITTHIRNHVSARLHEIYSEVAPANYASARKWFDTLAADFVALCKSVDVDADPGTIVKMDEQSRRSWVSAESIVGMLEEALNLVEAGAILAGAEPDDDPEVVRLPLVVRTAGLHRRRLWEAWTSTGRTGRWGALLRLGAKLGTADHPEKLESYARPPEIGVKFVRDARMGGGNRMVPFDPCDDEKPRPLLDRVKAAVGIAPTDSDDWSTE